MRTKSKLVAIMLVTLASACNYYNDKTSQDLASLTPGAISYSRVAQDVFIPKCVGCHGSHGGVNLESYGQAIKFAERVQNEALIQKSMPPDSPLNAYQSKVLALWLAEGAPLHAGDSPQIPPLQTPDPETSPAPEPSPVASPSPLIPGTISYARVAQEVFIPMCVGCHGNHGGVNLETYGQVIQFAKRVQNEALIEKSMPPKGPLSEYQRRLLDLWLEEGAPLNAGDSPQIPPLQMPNPQTSPSPVPSASPAASPTFASIVKDIFEPRCSKCHGPNGGHADIAVSDRNYLISKGLLIPGNPDGSKIYTILKLTGKGRMPPLSQGAPLTAEQIDTIKTWIANGATD